MILAWLMTVPRWAKLAAAGFLLALLVFTLHRCAISDAVGADRAQSAAEAHKTAREADAASRGVVDDVRGKVEKENEDARKAANAGNDPLRDGFDSLRAGKAGDRPPTP